MEFLKFATTYDENAIEKIVCEPMYNLPKNKELDNDEMLFTTQLGLINQNLNHPLQDFETFKDKKPAIYEMIEKRTKFCFTFKFKNPIAILFLAGFLESPGNVVLYLWYLQYWAFTHNVKEIDFEMLTTKIFPMGFFNNNDLSEIWKKQKVNTGEVRGSDNLLDYARAGMSIQFKDELEYVEKS